MKTLYDIDTRNAILITSDGRRYRLVPANGNFILTELKERYYVP